MASIAAHALAAVFSKETWERISFPRFERMKLRTC
jgi:hypothetical protein